MQCNYVVEMLFCNSESNHDMGGGEHSKSQILQMLLAVELEVITAPHNVVQGINFQVQDYMAYLVGHRDCEKGNN